jgi:hypothetical protein
VGRFLSPEAGEAAGAAAGEAAAPAAGEVPTEAATQGPAEAKPGIVARAARASIEPSEQIPEAKWIDDQFAKNGMAERLTVGQNAPRSGVGQIEQASLSLPEEGAAIFAKREAARTGWQNLGLKQALPPGMEKVPEGSLPEKLDAIYQGFKPAYSAIRNETVPPVVEGTPLADALPELANDPGVLATDADRAAAAKWLDNQATLIKGDAETVPAENLIEMRSNIRDQMRKLPNGSPFKAVLDRAEDAITQSLDEGLSPEAAQALHQTDAKYRLYKVMEDAVARGGDRPGGFTSFQAEQALRHAMDRGEFARGGGGFLRQWIRSGRAVFETTSPPTGARAVTLADKLKEYLTGKLATGMNAAAPAPEPTAMPQAAGRAAAAVAPSAVEGMAQGGEVTGATINRTGLDEPRSQLYDYMARRQGTPTTMLKDQRDEVRRDVSRRRQANPAQDFILSQVNPEYRRKAGSYDPSRKTPSVP